MPRVSAEHEQAVRKRIIDAGIKVFGEMGYNRASIQDVVRESGLSVGAVYTHFKGKEELFLVACACEAEEQSEDLRLRLQEMGSVGDRLRLAIDFAVEQTFSGVGSKSALAHAWPQVDSSPELRPILEEHRRDMIAFSERLLTDGVESGELPAWIDAHALASAMVTLLDAFALMGGESNLITIDDARRQARAILDLLLVAPRERP